MFASRRRRTHHPTFLEPLESRALFSTSCAVMVMDAPVAPPVQIDADSSAANATSTGTEASALDIQVRHVAGGIYLTVAASSLVISDPAPTGNINFYADGNFLGTVQLGTAFRSALVLDAGEHTFSASYAGDSLYLPSQTTVTKILEAPTNTAPTDGVDAFATNDAGERIRPTRFLARVNFFDSHGMTVALLPGGGNTGIKGPLMPTPRFSKVSFSLPAHTPPRKISAIDHVMHFGMRH